MRVADLRIWLIGAAIVLFGLSGFANAALERQALTRVANVNLAQIRKLQQIARRANGPKLILAGGSNTLYGLDADGIGRSLGVHAVNVGMFNLLNGQSNYTILLRSIVGPGDVVVFADSNWLVAPSLHQRENATLVERKLAASLFRSGSAEFSGIDSAALPTWSLLPESPMVSEIAKLLRPASYLKRGSSGDLLSRTAPRPIQPLAAPKVPPAPIIFERVRQLAALTKQRGATLFLEQPWVLINDLQRGAWQNYATALDKGLQPIAPVVGRDFETPGPFRTDGRQFCDSPFHLQPAMRATRSAQLVAWLKQQPALERLRNANIRR